MSYPPKWKKVFQPILHNMIEEGMGAMECSMELPGEIIYDPIEGEIESQPTVSTIKLAFIPIKYKDDLSDLPAGLRNKVIRYVYTVKPIPNNAKITTLFDKTEWRVITPSQPLSAGGEVHCYRTYLGQEETSTGTASTIYDEGNIQSPDTQQDDNNTGDDGEVIKING